MKVALSEDHLENVAGGMEMSCESTYEAGEWCWINDSCSFVVSWYEGNEDVSYSDEKDVMDDEDYPDDDV